MTEFDKKYSKYQNEFEIKLKKFCDELDCEPEILKKSLIYSLQIGGKRIRPVIMYAVSDMLNVPRSVIDNYAIAIELIHTYSLIHDDLPEMDNDDFRRGQPSNHKVFGVGNAVLAGDGLLNTAYSVLLNECFKGNEYISAAKYVCECAGINGMIAGQSADLLHENDEEVEEDTLNFIYTNKTAKLIMGAAIVPSILCGGKLFSEIKEFAKLLGHLFQLTDDILDVEGTFEIVGKSIGKDATEGKYTGIRLFGLDGCKIRADLICDRCIKLLECLNRDVQFLSELVYFVRQRIN